MDPSVSDGARAAAIHALAVDRTTIEVVTALHDRGVRPILLKGPSFSRWLYDDEVRDYVDTDLLVDPEQVPAAEQTLRDLGFALTPLDLDADELWVAREWVRRRDRRAVDLHRTVEGIRVAPAQAWAILSAATEPFPLGGADGEVLTAPARALHVALHATGDMPAGSKKAEDLRRAIDRVPVEVWAEATRLAERLDAVAAMSAGLRRLPAGAALADELGLDLPRDVRAVLRTAGPTGAAAVERIAAQPTLRAKARLALLQVFPPPAYVRARYLRDGGDLIRGYLRRWRWLADHAPAAYRAWRRSRDDAARPPER